jgi:hypothetical protein
MAWAFGWCPNALHADHRRFDIGAPPAQTCASGHLPTLRKDKYQRRVPGAIGVVGLSWLSVGVFGALGLEGDENEQADQEEDRGGEDQVPGEVG